MSSHGNYRATHKDRSSEGEATRRLARRAERTSPAVPQSCPGPQEVLGLQDSLHMIAKGGQLFRSCTNTMETWCMYQLDGVTSCSISTCVKLAWDYYDPVNMARHALIWLSIRGRYMPRNDDYMGAAVVLKNAIVSLYPKLKK